MDCALLLHTSPPSSSSFTSTHRINLKTTALSIIATHPFSSHYHLKVWKNIRKTHNNDRNFPAVCRASQLNSPITEFNLYELLGVEPSSDRAQIKEAYRTLQKRCHPDIAGPSGHDMAIVLNEVYALLSDPNSRMAYDKELAKVADLQGFTGKPIYSCWFGSESEERAVFVDEAKCVGCLKCALFADKTFAVESVYGRARVVAQWADPEYKIQEAIGACPVDCISIVERSKLAVLEFIMSKQPRGKVRIGAGNTGGARTSDVFDEAEKFQTRYAKHKASTNNSKELESHRASAIQAIQLISNWIYWRSPGRSNTDAKPPAIQNAGPRTQRHADPSVKRLKAAAAARKQATTTRPRQLSTSNEHEYWVPLALELPETTSPHSGSKALVDRPSMSTYKKEGYSKGIQVSRLNPEKGSRKNPLLWSVPMGMGAIAMVVARLHVVEEGSGGGIKDHIGGSLALAIVNSSWSQVVLAGVTWYLIGMYAVELVEAIRRK